MQHRETPLHVIALILYMKVDLGQRMKYCKGLADSRGLQDLFLPLSFIPAMGTVIHRHWVWSLAGYCQKTVGNYFAMDLQRRWTTMLPNPLCFSTFLYVFYNHILVNIKVSNWGAFDCSMYIEILLLLSPYQFYEMLSEKKQQHKSNRKRAFVESKNL